MPQREQLIDDIRANARHALWEYIEAIDQCTLRNLDQALHTITFDKSRVLQDSVDLAILLCGDPDALRAAAPKIRAQEEQIRAAIEGELPPLAESQERWAMLIMVY